MIDLHLHLDGSLSADDILELGRISGVTLPTADKSKLCAMLSVQPDCTDLAQYLEKFDLPLKVLQTEKSISRAVYLLIRRLSKQGLLYAEIRFAPQLHTNCGLSQREVIAAAVDGLNKGIADFDFTAQLILCCMRGSDNHDANIKTIHLAAEYLGKGVCALDLAGNEAAYPTSQFADIFAIAKSLSVPFTVHAGEAASADSVRAALDFGAVRIGHGIHSAEDERLMVLLRDTQTPLELCFTSNLQTKAAKSISDYPLKTFLDKGICVTLNTDNMTVSNTTLKDEYLLVKRHFALDTASLMKIAQNGANGAFLPTEQKRRLCDKIEQNFADWLK